MNSRSVFSSRSDPKCLDEEHAGDGGRNERDEQHVAPSQQSPFRIEDLNESSDLALTHGTPRGRANTAGVAQGGTASPTLLAAFA
jgi:hypothetical protein